MPELQIILDAIKTMQESNHDCIESLRSELHTGLRASAVQIDVEMGIVNKEIKILASRIEKQNSNVASLQTESNNRQQAVHDFRDLEAKHKKRDEWINKNKIFLFGAFVIIVALIVVIVELIGAKAIIQNIVDKMV